MRQSLGIINRKWLGMKKTLEIMQRWQPNELSNNGFSFEKSADVVRPMNLFDV